MANVRLAGIKRTGVYQPEVSTHDQNADIFKCLLWDAMKARG
jgi:hypothetical protein